MIKSAWLYSKNIGKLFLSKDKNIVAFDLKRFAENQHRKFKPEELPLRKAALDDAIQWLMHAQQAKADKGMGSYHLGSGWSSSYPETTGYIIPTLLTYGQIYNENKAIEAAFNAADWLLDIQRSSGGWQGGRLQDNKPEVVFNTAQIIRGMLAVYKYTRDYNFMEAALKAAKWLVSIQDAEGFWKENALMQEARVYDAYVDAPLLLVNDEIPDPSFKEAAVKNLDWIINKKQLGNGWFEDCDNTIKRNSKPILHTIAYTLDGLIDCGSMLGDDLYINKAGIAADELMKQFMAKGILNGRYNQNWKGSEYFICTGGAQMAIVWMKLFKHTQKQAYLEAASKMIDLLVFIQSRSVKQTKDTSGALQGSYPVWGRYEPFTFPNWAAKYLADALLLEMEVLQTVDQS